MIASIAFFLGIGRFRTDPYGGKLITILNVDTYNTEEIYWRHWPAVGDVFTVPILFVHQDAVLDVKEGIAHLK